MGYYTDFEGLITGFKGQEEAEWVEFKLKKNLAEFWTERLQQQGDTLSFYLPDTKWYSWEKDLLKFSEDYPHLLVELEGDGEDQGDQWKARFKSGKLEVVQAIIYFPEFKDIT